MQDCSTEYIQCFGSVKSALETRKIYWKHMIVYLAGGKKSEQDFYLISKD